MKTVLSQYLLLQTESVFFLIIIVSRSVVHPLQLKINLNIISFTSRPIADKFMSKLYSLRSLSLTEIMVINDRSVLRSVSFSHDS